MTIKLLMIAVLYGLLYVAFKYSENKQEDEEQ
jgi:hypothetical protein